MKHPPQSSLVVVSLGSNVDPERNLPRALRRLEEIATVRGRSRVWRTQPVGAPGTPAFLNAAVLIETEHTAGRLRRLLRDIEAALGRVRTADRNAPRTIDLDIAIVEARVIEDRESDLRIPDPDLLRRSHVAYPAAEVAPRLRHPVDGRALAAIAAELGPPGEPTELPGWPAAATG